MPQSAGALYSGDLYSAMLEVVRPTLEDLFETSDQLAGLIKKSLEVQIISDRLWRIPFRKYRGGTFGKYDLENGAFPSGTGMLTDNFTAGFFPSAFVVNLTDAAVYTTQNKTQAIVNAMKTSLSESMAELQVYDDIVLHTDGTGAVTDYNVGASATGTWGSSLTTYTFANAFDKLGVNRLREGMVVEVWSGVQASGGTIAYQAYNTNAVSGTLVYPGSGGTLVTKKTPSTATDPIVIDHIDWDNKVVYLSKAISSAAAATGDFLTFSGMAAFGPAYPATIQSAWPTYTQSSGIVSGDSFRHGIYYANDNTTTDYYMGKLRSGNTQLQPSYVNAAGGYLVHNMVLQLLDQLVQHRDMEIVRGLMGIFHMSQRAQIFNIGIAISNWFRGAKDKMIDIMPSNVAYTDRFEVVGIPCILDKRQFRDRVDFINPKKWARAQLFDTQFRNVGGTTIFENRSSTGAQTAGRHFIYEQAYDYVCVDPGAQGFINNIAVPSGY